MWTDGNGNFLMGDCPQFWREATDAEVAAYNQANLWPAYQAKCQALLDNSDMVVLRCYEHAVAVPTLWQSYRSSLRAILSAKIGDPTQPLPERPDFPEGT